MRRRYPCTVLNNMFAYDIICLRISIQKHAYRQMRARRVLMLSNALLLRTRKALLAVGKVFGGSGLLVINVTVLKSVSSLLALT